MKGLLTLFYPPLCQHCQESLSVGNKILCAACWQQLELLDVQERCSLCFQECADQECVDKGSVEVVCRKCLANPPSFTKLASCFSYAGPAKSLLVSFKYAENPYLADSLASLMMLQQDIANFPLPDIITYIPQSFLRAATRGYNPSELLARSLGQLMQRPVIGLLKKRAFSFSQTQASKKQRKELMPDTFMLKEIASIKDQTILIVDDVATTGATLECASYLIQSQGPKAIYACTLLLTEL